MSKIVECNNINFYYKNNKTAVLKDIKLTINSSESIAILGKSGCGKSTLLNIIAGFNKPNSGNVLIANKDIYAINESARTKLRANNLGFVYQANYLLKDFSIIDNVIMPLLIQGENKKIAIEKAKDILNKIELSHRFYSKPGEISGGERQKAAIARAIINKPKCIIADEPTGSVDEKSSNIILSMLLELSKKQNSAIIIVTHDTDIAKEMDRTAILENKEINFI